MQLYTNRFEDSKKYKDLAEEDKHRTEHLSQGHSAKQNLKIRNTERKTHGPWSLITSQSTTLGAADATTPGASSPARALVLLVISRVEQKQEPSGVV